MKWCIIKYSEEMKTWHLTTPNYYTNLKEAKELSETIPGETQVIHECWVECLTEWPSPQEQKEMYETNG